MQLARKILLCGTILLGLLVAIGMVGVVGFERSVDGRVDRLLEQEALSAAAPWTGAAHEAGLELERLFEELDLAVGGAQEPVPGGGIPCAPWQWAPEHAASLHDAVRRAAPVLRQLDRLLARPEVLAAIRAEHTYVEGSRPIPLLMTTRLWCYALSGAAVDLSRRGESEAAAGRLLRGFELLRAGDSGLLSSTLIARSERSVLLEAVLRVVAEDPAAAPVLRRELEPELARLARESSGAKSVLADLAWFLQDSRERSRLSRSWRERFAIAGELHERLDEIEAGESLLFERLHEDSPGSPWTLDMGQTRVVPNRSWVEGERPSRTRLQLVRVLLALLVHHERADEWPRELDELAPLFPKGVPTDPATDSSFCYERTPIGFHLSAAEIDPDGVGEDASPLWRGEIDWPDSALAH